MAIRLYTGIPGSGKTYRVVYEIMKGGLLNKYYVLHNIPNLKLEGHIKSYHHENNEIGIEPKDLFTFEQQKRLSEKIKEKYDKPMLVVVDECDKLGLDKVDRSQKEWLSMHRHLGQDIYLVTQSRYNIAKDYNNLIELEIQGKRGFLTSQFVYRWSAQGEQFAIDRIPKDKKVFQAYRSFHIEELRKPKSNIFKYMLAAGILAAVFMGYFIFWGVPGKFREVGLSSSGSRSMEQKIREAFAQDPLVVEAVSRAGSQKVFAGSVPGSMYLADEWGNLYALDPESLDQVYDPVGKNASYKRLVLLDPENGLQEYRAGYVRKTMTTKSEGRAARGEAASPEAVERVREIWISVK